VPKTGTVIFSVVGIVQTIPSLALLAFLIALLGAIGTVPALVALFLYALLPIVRNTCTGLVGIPRGMRQAALALGLSTSDRMRLIEVPLALPSILAGINTSAVINVGTATIAAFIGAGGHASASPRAGAERQRDRLRAPYPGGARPPHPGHVRARRAALRVDGAGQEMTLLARLLLRGPGRRCGCPERSASGR
jgi:osmoprotectant transport system permease protein